MPVVDISEEQAPTQAAILDAIKAADKAISPKEIVAQTGLPKGSVQPTLRKMLDAGLIAKPEYGKYDLPKNVESSEIGSESEVGGESGDGMPVPLGEAGGGTGKDNGAEMITVSRRHLRSILGYAPSPQNIFAVRVVGSSMEPWIRNGQIVICERRTTVGASGRYVYWLDSEEGYVIKDMERANKDGAIRVTQHGPNPRSEVFTPTEETNIYRDESGELHHVKIEGRVIYPDDTARAVLSQVENSLRKVMGQG